MDIAPQDNFCEIACVSGSDMASFEAILAPRLSETKLQDNKVIKILLLQTPTSFLFGTKFADKQGAAQVEYFLADALLMNSYVDMTDVAAASLLYLPTTCLKHGENTENSLQCVTRLGFQITH